MLDLVYTLLSIKVVRVPFQSQCLLCNHFFMLHRWKNGLSARKTGSRTPPTLLQVYNKEPLTSGAGGGVIVTWDQRLLPTNPEVVLHALTSQETKQGGRPLRKLLQWAADRLCLDTSVGMHRVNVSFRAMLGNWRPMQRLNDVTLVAIIPTEKQAVLKRFAG